VSPDDRDFERFARQLDDEWTRERLRALAPPLALTEADELVRDLEGADPLGERVRPRWRDALRDAWGSWPGRLALATAVVLLLVVGFVAGRVTLEGRGRALLALPPLPSYAPPGPSGARLGVAPAVAPESERRFREAMAFYGTPDFPARALPLLHEAVAADASNDEARFWLGVALLWKRQSGEAIRHLERARALAPGNRHYAQYLLFAYLQAGAADKAAALQAELLREGAKE
jgi:tetratricopeptide (TPR) repeat protein